MIDMYEDDTYLVLPSWQFGVYIYFTLSLLDILHCVAQTLYYIYLLSLVFHMFTVFTYDWHLLQNWLHPMHRAAVSCLDLENAAFQRRRTLHATATASANLLCTTYAAITMAMVDCCVWSASKEIADVIKVYIARFSLLTASMSLS